MKRQELNLILRCGTVLYKSNRNLTSAEPHYLIVLNDTPYEQIGIVVSVVTSQIEKRRKYVTRLGFPESTLVLLPKECYPHFAKDSAVDCNELTTIAFDDLLGYTSKDFKSPDFPQEYLQQIIHGALASPRVADDIKELLKSTL